MPFEKELNKKHLKLAEKALLGREICNNCLGRQFAKISTGLTNRERGEKIRKLLKSKEQDYCEACDNIFKELDELADKTTDRLKNIEFETFLVGTKMNHEFALREETLWESIGIEHCEPMRSELNRELGKIIEKRTKKKFDKNPDIVIFIDLDKRDTRVDINPIFIYGKYKKLARGLPQTKWDKYPETVEDIIAKPFMEETKGRDHSLHGMGREDIDARCLGWRPFVLQISKPRKRKLDLDKIEKEIKKTKKVEVSNLRPSTKQEVREVKSARPEKTYRALVSFEKKPKKSDLDNLKKLAGKQVSQKTPKRVLHRRADKTRNRKVMSIKWKTKGDKIEFEIKGEAGLYIKELVTGDEGRTKPSISEILKSQGKVEELDVIKVWA